MIIIKYWIPRILQSSESDLKKRKNKQKEKKFKSCEKVPKVAKVWVCKVCFVGHESCFQLGRGFKL